MPRGRPRKESAPDGPKVKPRRGAKGPTLPLARRLVLNQWMLSLFGASKTDDLAKRLSADGLEGRDADGTYRFHHALTAALFNETHLSAEELLRHDQEIVTHTDRLNERRRTHGAEPIVWKSFQYLALLFTEIYLDRWFTDPEGLRRDLNAWIDKFNEDRAEADRVTPFTADGGTDQELNKVAFWMATGSGKTLVMQVNILQFRRRLERHGRAGELNRIILLTPNEGLTLQHAEEFRISGIDAVPFDKNVSASFSRQFVQILEVTRLRDKDGKETVDVAAFEGKNLVLVDEGHRGTSGGESGTWMEHRRSLCEGGFSFEYSATFGQAVKGSAKLNDLYAKCTLFDYSYPHFYREGFGKDYQILNLDQATAADHLEIYLVAALLSFFQQQRLFQDEAPQMRRFLIERPLWIFVGGSVTATLAKQDASDIVQILSFLARFVQDRAASVQRIDRVLNQGLLTSKGKDLFERRFEYLNTRGLGAAEFFDEILALLFNAPAGGRLYVEHLKGSSGELALRLGVESEAFGVINVGSPDELLKLCEKHGLSTGTREFSGSLFQSLNDQDSRVNLLIGSKKFTEGWSSWRVSTMGLLHVGRTEGAQIIQLFGRGVRLKGYERSLKRSSRIELPPSVPRPRYIGVLETLGIFGVQADYMAQFREFLLEEDLPTNEDRIEFLLPVIKNLGTQPLKTIRLKSKIRDVSTEFGEAFRKLAPVPTVRLPRGEDPLEHEHFQEQRIVLDWYPRIQALKSIDARGGEGDGNKQAHHLTRRHVSLLDLDQLAFDLERFRAERGWYNLNLPPDHLRALLADTSWYELQIPEEELRFGTLARVREWQEIALALLKKYTERYYTYRKREWEMPHLEYRDLASDDPNFLCVRENPEDAHYRIVLDRSQDEIAAKLTELKSILETGKLRPWEFRGLKAIWFGRHLYQPLLFLDSDTVEISPVPLNQGEKDFVLDLRDFHDSKPALLAGRELYLLRNLSRGRGVGFFEAGNFYPDFILWLLSPGAQHIFFIDPKGIRHLSASDPKIHFHATIKDLERRLADPRIHLHSFILSNTPSHTMSALWSLDKATMTHRHILFPSEDRETYLLEMLSRAFAAKPGSPSDFSSRR